MKDVRLSDKYQIRQQRKAKKMRRIRNICILSGCAVLICTGVILYCLGVFSRKEPALPVGGPIQDSNMIGIAQPTIMALVDVTPGPTAIADPVPILVNSKNSLPDGYVPENLVVLSEYCDPDILTAEPATLMGVQTAVDSLMEMIAAAQTDGFAKWQVTDAYRSYEQQQGLWNTRYQTYIEEGMTEDRATRATNNRVAKVGTSDHHTGLSFDLNIPGQSFKYTDEFQWILKHGWEYGFILRFPEGKETYTGVSYEPWHVRYVGQPHAFNIRRTGMCLEEYISGLDK